jgi:DNA-binding NarL/FixJ family response regulator
MLKSEQDLNVIGQGGSAAEAIDLAKKLRPHLIILDLDMPGGGIEAATWIARAMPSIKIVILTVLSDENLIQPLRQAGAHGYLVKGISARALAKAIRSIGSGAMYWPSFSAAGL